MKVPQLFVASGATTFGRDYAQYPYTIGFQPSYQAEGWVYGKYLARTAPGAKVAVLFQNDDYGKDLLGGLKRGLQRSKVKVVAAQPYEVDVARRRVADREAEGIGRRHARDLRDADVRDPGVPVREQARLEAEARDQQRRRVGVDVHADRVASGGQNKLVNGTISIVFLKDPTDPKWKKDAGDEALPEDHEAVRAERERERRAPRLRHGGRVDGRRRAQARPARI